MGAVKDLTGQKFGRLTVIERAGSRAWGRGSHATWLCECECGNKCVVVGSQLLSGITQSCGCLRKEVASERGKVHVQPKEIIRIRKIFRGMKRRCYEKTEQSYKNYGARGIGICDEWLEDAEKFVEWSLKNGYRQGLQIDRIDNNGGYNPQNCRWTTCRTNSNNKRNTVRLKDGTPFAEYCYSLGVKTNIGRKATAEYERYLRYYLKKGEIHPELKRLEEIKNGEVGGHSN